MIVGTGVDLVEIARLRKIIQNLNRRFVQRVFTEGEQSFCDQRRDPAPHYAARFAAKEALFKALGTGWAQGVTWRDAEVRRNEHEAPALILHGEALRRCQALGADRIHLSLTHSEQYAIATVILESDHSKKSTTGA